MYKNFVKPVSDWVIAFIFLLLVSPVILVISLILLFRNKGKIFFVQKRIGLHEKPFYLLKFRTLTDKKDESGNLLPDVERQSAFGNFLRNYHLDELPQLVNVLKNELSLVGPRPLLPEYLSYYSEVEKIRHTCRPGITGLVQVMGGNLLTWPQWLRLDVFYARHVGFGLDCRIIRLTARYFLRKKSTVTTRQLFSESLIDYKKRAQITRI
jgi:undecaprenyl phosphate N,N'-diacetylbacillosamine 1-phosphate transferase